MEKSREKDPNIAARKFLCNMEKAKETHQLGDSWCEQKAQRN